MTTIGTAALVALTACGSGSPNGVDPGASLPSGAVADCPVPGTPSSSPINGISSTTSTGTAVVTPQRGGGPITPTATSSATETVPGYPYVAMPTAAPAESGDAAVTTVLDRAVTLHMGRTLRLTFGPTAAVVVPRSPNPSVLKLDGRSCEPDGSAIFAYSALAPGTVVFILELGPRCVHARPPCLAGEQAVPLRVDVVS